MYLYKAGALVYSWRQHFLKTGLNVNYPMGGKTMGHNVLEERKDLFVIQTDAGISTVPKSAYFILKLKHFDGNRIFFNFGKNDARVEETFDDGIFNCYHGEHSVQISDGQSVAKVVLDNNYDEFFALFARWHGIQKQQETLDIMFRPYGNRVKFNKKQDRYEIDDIYGVNAHGVGAYRTEDGNWHSLCLVAQQSVKPKEIDLPEIGPTVLNEITQTILAKVMFLLFPTTERVFMSQLPEYAKRHVEHLVKNNQAVRQAKDMR